MNVPFVHDTRIGWPRLALILLAGCASLTTCSSQEAPRVEVPVHLGAAPAAPFSTDLGYTVTLTRARTAVRDLAFTTGGETHARLDWGDNVRAQPFWTRIRGWLLPAAQAHPGHHAGGEILGALPGAFVLDWFEAGSPVGQATLIVGEYSGLNLTFRRATAAELPPGDPLAGHSAELGGTASKGGRAVTFTMFVDLDEGAAVVGAPFLGGSNGPVDPTPRRWRVHQAANAPLGIAFLPTDPTEAADTLFDQIDFVALAATAASLTIPVGTEAHNRVARKLQIHDHYAVTSP